jgi:predicted RecA/RadA family phage recombinase
VVVQGSIIGIAVTDIANGATGEIMVEGVFDLPKVDAAVITAGEGVIWDSSAGEFDDDAATPATGDVSGAAIAMESKGATTGETIKVKLGRAPGTVT